MQRMAAELSADGAGHGGLVGTAAEAVELGTDVDVRVQVLADEPSAA
jgi:hypothetical protein